VVLITLYTILVGKGPNHMTEARLIHIEQMMTELIRIVGNTNAAVEELRAEVAELRSEVAELRAEVAELRSRVDQLTEGQQRIEVRLDRLEKEVKEIREDQKALFEIVGEHEVAIRVLRRRPV
jgi:chromosome segregation ATPase